MHLTVNGPPPSKAEAPQQGLSPFLAHVFELLSITSWFPAALVVVNFGVLTALLLSHDAVRADVQKEWNVLKGLQALGDVLDKKPIGVILGALVLLVVTALLTQSWEYGAIRFLEGYWGGSALAAPFTSAGIKWQRARQGFLLKRARELDSRVFTLCENRVRRDLKADPNAALAADYIRKGSDISGFGEGTLRTAREYLSSRAWLASAPAELRHRLNSVEKRLEQFPLGSRMMPTRLGNTLRSAEDRIRGLKRETSPRPNAMRGFVVRHADKIGPILLTEHHTYRRRLDLYAIMTLLCPILSLANFVVLYQVSGATLGAVVALAFLALSWSSYRAAVSAATGYGMVLEGIDELVLEAGSKAMRRRD